MYTYTFTVTLSNGRVVTKVVNASSEETARRDALSLFVSEGIRIDGNALTLTNTNQPNGGQAVSGANPPADGGVPERSPLSIDLRDPRSVGAGSTSSLPPGIPPIPTLQNTPVVRSSDLQPSIGGATPETPGQFGASLTPREQLDLDALDGFYDVPFRQTVRGIYGEGLDQSSSLSRVLGNAQQDYEAAFRADGLANPRPNRSFGDFVSQNDPLEARASAGRSVLSLVDNNGIQPGSTNDVLNAIRSASRSFGSAFSQASSGAISRLFDTLSGHDNARTLTPRVASSAIEEAVPELLQGLRRLGN